MYRAILPDGNLTSARFERSDHGVELFTKDEELLAFIPYENLIAVINDEVERAEDRSIL